MPRRRHRRSSQSAVGAHGARNAAETTPHPQARSSPKERERTMEGAPLDPYVELVVPRTAPTSDITDAYPRLVRRHHPDTRDPAAHASDTALIRVMAEVQ